LGTNGYLGALGLGRYDYMYRLYRIFNGA